jgi:alpha-mannosidase
MTHPVIYLVPHTHYDAIWVFNKDDYFYINIEFIMKQAVDLMKTTDYKFLIEQTFLLEHIENSYPKLFEDIQGLAKENKIEIAGGQYLLSDVMLPNGEVLIKEIAVGKRYVKDKLFQNVSVAWGSDEFGFNAQWPQILLGCGYKYFAFRRGLDKPKPSEFLWEGLDGSRIICHWMPLGYRAGLDLTKLDEAYNELKKYAATSQILMPSGSGVTLPQPETSAVVKQWNNNNSGRNRHGSKAKMIVATPVQFFKALGREKVDFQIRKGEMYSGRLSEVFPDCTSSRMWIKQRTKEFETYLLTLERLDAICNLEECVTLSPDKLKSYWRKILFVAMHDALPGTGIDEIYEEIKEIFDDLEDTIKKSIIACLNELTKIIKDKADLIVFNPLSWQVRNWCESVLEFDEGVIKGIESLKSCNEDGGCSGGETIDFEILNYSLHTDRSIKMIKIGFIPTVPALGFATFKIVKGEDKPTEELYINPLSPSSSFSLEGTTLQQKNNNGFEIQVDPDSAIVTVTKNGKMYFKGNELLVEEELGDLYYHRENLGLLKSESGQGVKYGSFKADNFRVSRGKLRSRIVLDSNYYALRWPYRLTNKLKPILFRHKYIDIKKEVIIYNELPRIDFITHIHDRHPHSRIRLKFGTSLSAKNYWSGTQFGAIKRRTDQFYSSKGNKKRSEKPTGVFPCLEWMDYSDKDMGISVLHQGIPSHEIRDHSIYLTLLRSVVVLSADGIMGPCVPTPDAAEIRPYTFRYSVLPHEGDWREAASYRHGMEINMPMISIQIKHDNKTAGRENIEKMSLTNRSSFLEIEPKNIILSSFKISEDGKAIIVRFFETEGTRTVAKLRFGKMIKSVSITDLLENEIKKIKKTEQYGLQIEVDPYRIVTLKIEF